MSSLRGSALFRLVRLPSKRQELFTRMTRQGRLSMSGLRGRSIEDLGAEHCQLFYRLLLCRWGYVWLVELLGARLAH
ncbi:hypothetical protein Ae717Ps2_7096c [Pseudonocardia sp. Ae717_Ps2]|nr:hypothetical protein Ae717Ps2_7096c [Pseudonocardia sp. Ae717_Ps2]